MGRKSGITSGGYHPRIWQMQRAMFEREIRAFEEYQAMKKKKLAAMYWSQRMVNALDVLKSVDAAGWERWYDDDKNIPLVAKHKDFAFLLEARVRSLTGSYPRIKCSVWRDVFVWQDALGAFVYSKEIGKAQLYAIEFRDLKVTKEFIDGLAFENCGYGVVLDILPASAMAMVEA